MVGDRTVAQLVAAARGGDRRAAARLLTLVEQGGQPADEVAGATHQLVDIAHVVAVPGPPGAGKSTLTAAHTTFLAEKGRQIGRAHACTPVKN